MRWSVGGINKLILLKELWNIYLVIDLNVSVNSQKEGTKKSPGKLYIASNIYKLMKKSLGNKSSEEELEI